MAPQQSNGDDLIHNVLSEETGQSSFACSHCRRQKVKCDRALPSCSNCNKATRPCSYPLTVQKPGPKAGTHRRPRSGTTRQLGHAEDPTFLSKRTKIDHQDQGQSLEHPTQTYSRYADVRQHGQYNAQGLGVSISNDSQSPKAAARPDNPLARIVHPDHSHSDRIKQTPRNSDSIEEGFNLRYFTACANLGCSESQGWELVKAYFEYQTSFSLFHRPTFEQKLRGITIPLQLQAFLSSLFSYALRFKENIPSIKVTDLSAKLMLDLSCQLHQRCIEDCLDDDPPLHLLQSLYLATFQKLVEGVKGKTWRMLGDCVRIGYELRLHIIDLDTLRSADDDSTSTTIEGWVEKEERRRMWWCLWESDIFTSTIRRLPSAIDERINFTLLPVPDEDWFAGVESESCFLVPSATQRWRSIVESGNRSSQTWFILVNSYMYDAHKMHEFPEIWAKRIGFDLSAPPGSNGSDMLVPRMRDFIDKCLRSAYMELPRELSWEDRFLAFRASTSSHKASLRTQDSARYCIHVMSQLCRLMMCIWEVHQTLTVRNDNGPGSSDGASASIPSNKDSDDRRVWDRYLEAANMIAEVVRNSSPQHYQFVNPLIANTLWYAAASLVVAKLFGPRGFDSRLAQSNFDLLTATLNKFEAFWQIPSALKHRLRTLEGTLSALKRKHAALARSDGTTPTTAGSPIPDSSIHDPSQVSSENFELRPPLPQPPEFKLQDIVSQDVNDQNWLAESFLDFDTIPTLGTGQADLLQQFPFDLAYDENAIMASNENMWFNGTIFNYPYL